MESEMLLDYYVIIEYLSNWKKILQDGCRTNALCRIFRFLALDKFLEL